MSVTENINIVEERILKVCNASGRKREEITLMAVTKFVPVAMIEEAQKAGICFFGESRVQEAAQKFAAQKFAAQKFAAQKFAQKFGEMQNRNYELHMIGSLQRNKAKAAVKLFDCIQSVDRIELIKELARILGSQQGRETPLKVLLELHTGEESKSGFAGLDALFEGAEMLLNTPGVEPVGLMTMAPYFGDMSISAGDKQAINAVRSSFRQIVKAKEELIKRFGSANGASWECLSMGMSSDFEIAVEEGSTMLRIGSIIFSDNLHSK